MKCAGIISEFNPFHTGHRHLIDSIREVTAPDAVVCVMSGDFVQRGMPAMWDKYDRAQTAIEGGADLVLELPAVYAVSGAGSFARGGVKVLKGLGCVKYLGFGSESGNGELLMQAASVLSREPEAFSNALRDELALGRSYPAAYISAAAEIGLDPRLFSGANDILALEYLKQNLLQDAGFEPAAVLRQGAKHNSSFTADGYASASYLRELALDIPGNYEELKKYLLPESLELLSSRPHFGRTEEDRYFRIISHMLQAVNAKEAAQAAEISEGFEAQLIKSAWSADSLDSLIMGAKIKRFTYARIARMLCQLFLGITKSVVKRCEEEDLCYAKVLAFNNTGAEVLRTAQEQGSIPVISNVNKDRKSSPAIRPMLEVDIRASELYGLIMGSSPKDYSDLTCIPKPCNI